MIGVPLKLDEMKRHQLELSTFIRPTAGQEAQKKRRMGQEYEIGESRFCASLTALREFGSKCFFCLLFCLFFNGAFSLFVATKGRMSLNLRRLRDPTAVVTVEFDRCSEE